MNPVENISRRELIKLITLAGVAMPRPVSLLADAVPGQSAGAGAAAVLPTAHPRLFYNAASLKHLRQILATDVAADASLKKRGEELLAADLIAEAVAMRGEGQHANYGKPGNQMSEMGLTLGLLYQLTGDKRYADKLRQAMLYYSNYVRWTGQSFEHRSPPWYSELDTAKFSFGFATGYDALHSILSDVDRKTISDAMIRLSVLPVLNDWVLPGASIPLTPWDIIGGAFASRVPACAPWHCWAMCHRRKNGSSPWMRALNSGSIIGAMCRRTA